MQTTRSDDPLAEYALDSRLAGDIPAHTTGEIHTVRDVAVHMVEEIARHAGHPDIAHELLDGQTGPGTRLTTRPRDPAEAQAARLGSGSAD